MGMQNRRGNDALSLTVFFGIFVLLGLPVVRAQQAERLTDGFILTLMVQSIDGLTLKDVALEFYEGEDRLFAAKSNEHGVVRAELGAIEDPDAIQIKVSDPRYRLMSKRQQTSRAGNQLWSLQLYRADAVDDTESERRARIRLLPEILKGQRAEREALPGNPDRPNPIRLSAFLAGTRTIAQPDFEELRQIRTTPEGDAPDTAPVVSFRVLDELGNPAAGRRVILYGLRGKDAVALNTAISGDDGRGSLRALSGELLRLEVLPLRDDLAGRSSLFALKDEDRIERTLVLRPESRMLTGFVFDGEMPLPRADVEVNAGGATISARTDEYGFFSLGPVMTEETTLTITPYRQTRNYSMETRPGAGDLFIDIGLLILHQPAGSSL